MTFAIKQIKDCKTPAEMLELAAERMAQNVCVICIKPNALSRCHTELGIAEFGTSGICEECFDSMFGEEEE